jgi:hypothetical protein
MKLHRLVFVSTGAALSLFVCAANSSHATTATPLQNAGDGFSQSPGFQEIKWEEAKAAKLRHAYVILARGDHDYKGHRVKAMEHIEAAAAILGVDLHGGEYADHHERQGLSDVQLREAKHSLEDIVDETHGKEHDHIRKAMNEIDTSLALR